LYQIDDKIAYKEFKEYLLEKPEILSVKGNVITTKDFEVEVDSEYSDLLDLIKPEKAREFDISGYSTNEIKHQGYVFKTF